MHDLGKDLCAAFVNFVGQVFQGGDILFVGQQRHIVGVTHLVPLHIGKDNQAYAAFCSAAVEIGNLFVQNSVNAVAHAHGGHDHTVSDFHTVNLHGGVQLFHMASSFQNVCEESAFDSNNSFFFELYDLFFCVAAGFQTFRCVLALPGRKQRLPCRRF